MRAAPALSSLVMLLAVLGPAPDASGRACSDPCLQAARLEHRDCTTSAAGDLADALDACVAGARDCVGACLSRREDCHDRTNAGAELARCELEVVAAKDQCRSRFPPGSTARVVCLYRAEVAGLRCRLDAGRNVREDLQQCRTEFRRCAGTCGPGAPPGGTASCSAEARAGFGAARSACRSTLAVTVAGCLDKDLTCTQSCSDAREACRDATGATLAAAVMACTAQEAADVAACQAANPGGGSAYDQCVTTAGAAANTCRASALAAARSGLGACTGDHARCIRACPAA